VSFVRFVVSSQTIGNDGDLAGQLAGWHQYNRPMTSLIVHARCAALVFGFVALSAIPASAQLLAAKDGPVVYGHHHLNVTSIDAHKKFWIDTLGGTSVKVGTSPNEIVMFPNVLIFLRQQAPTGGTKGTTVNHIAFAVRDVRQMRDKARAAGYPIVTREEAGAGDVVTDDVSFNKEQGSYSIFVMGPDDIKAQFFEVKNLEAFCKNLESEGVKIDRPYTKVPALNIAIAFIYDPWGTYIELTEGLDKVQ
jgi:predicted enzyme related to lactoylglutathione lyase